MLEVNKGPLWPETTGEFLAGDDVTRAFQHQAEDFERLLLETDAVLPLSQLPGAHIELERFKTERAFGVHSELSPVHLRVCATDNSRSPTFHLVSPPMH